MNVDPTVERLNFDNYSNATVEHLHRYAIVMEFITNKIVLDIASGEGYGSYLMSKKANYVFGVDNDALAIKNADQKYKNTNLKFLQGNADSIPIEDASVDVVVSFETIEHHDKHHEMFSEIKRLLKPDGLLIMSSPDKKYYSDITGYKNKFHIKELYFNEFKDLTQQYFQYTSFYFQKAYNLNSYIAAEQSFETINIFSGDSNDLFAEVIEPMYNIVLASNNTAPKLMPSIFNGQFISKALINTLLDKRIKNVKQSISFKMGKFIVAPFVYIKRLFN